MVINETPVEFVEKQIKLKEMIFFIYKKSVYNRVIFEEKIIKHNHDLDFLIKELEKIKSETFDFGVKTIDCVIEELLKRKSYFKIKNLVNE